MRVLLTLLVLSGAALIPQLRAAEEYADIQNRIVSFKLDNGLTVILYPRPAAPVITCITYVKVGSVDEHVGITGIAHQLEHLAFKGTPYIGTTNYSAERTDFAELDGLYGKIQAFEQTLPTEAREPFLSLIAQYTSSGGAGAELDAKIEKDLGELAAGWKKDGIAVPPEKLKDVGALLLAFSKAVKVAEEPVVQNQYSQVIDREGGSNLNAFTSDDCTVYQISLPANKLELWAALESDRFMNTVPRQLEKEKQVVLEERRMRTESSAFGRLYENFLGVAFSAHPYGVPIIGYRSDILGYTREKVSRFYAAHYTPKNTTVCIVGDLDVSKAREIVTNYFGRVPKGPENEPLVTIEPEQIGERRFEVEFPAQPALMMGFHIPERKHPDTPALLALDAVLTNGRSSRLFSALEKTGKAQSVGSWVGPGERYPRLFFITAEPTQDTTIDEVEKIVLAELDKLKEAPPSAEELQRVVTAYRAGVLWKLKDSMYLAIELADYNATTGNWHNLFSEIKRISEVKPEDVSEMVRKYCTKKNRTVGRLVTVEEKAGEAK
jgi:predicted Zn-dependent peptidase